MTTSAGVHPRLPPEQFVLFQTTSPSLMLKYTSKSGRDVTLSSLTVVRKTSGPGTTYESPLKKQKGHIFKIFESLHLEKQTHAIW